MILLNTSYFTKYSLVFCCFLVISCASNHVIFDSEKMNGLTVVAPPDPYKENPFDSISEIGANWVAFVPYAFQRKKEAKVRYPLSNHQWWGETPEGIKASIREAKAKGLKIMLKPQVYIPGDFTGNMTFVNENDWLVWEESYTDYIMSMAVICEDQAVELFCIGTELKLAVKER